MTTQERALMAVALLENAYPDAICSLTYKRPHELLVATRLSAQCTDARVNLVTAVLFSRYPSLESLAGADLSELEEIIRPCGLYRTKAQNVIGMSRMLLERYGGILPDTVEELTRLPGIGRKTANLIVGDIYHKPAVVCDTHCIRINNRLGLIDTQDPYKAELALRECLPPDKSNDYCHRLVLHGRAVCRARTPLCGRCALSACCRFFYP
jgi:endonuclease-3